mmetsp:Transcript_42179/g.133125  ORF Transcript_42179/g.133125 Transcript_42179/m.133125 type:complete len:119 (+) Transcript_42179:76-432(+)
MIGFCEFAAPLSANAMYVSAGDLTMTTSVGPATTRVGPAATPSIADLRAMGAPRKPQGFNEGAAICNRLTVGTNALWAKSTAATALPRTAATSPGDERRTVAMADVRVCRVRAAQWWA